MHVRRARRDRRWRRHRRGSGRTAPTRRPGRAQLARAVASLDGQGGRAGAADRARSRSSTATDGGRAGARPAPAGPATALARSAGVNGASSTSERSSLNSARARPAGKCAPASSTAAGGSAAAPAPRSARRSRAGPPPSASISTRSAAPRSGGQGVQRLGRGDLEREPAASPARPGRRKRGADHQHAMLVGEDGWAHGLMRFGRRRRAPGLGAACSVHAGQDQVDGAGLAPIGQRDWAAGRCRRPAWSAAG